MENYWYDIDTIEEFSPDENHRTQTVEDNSFEIMFEQSDLVYDVLLTVEGETQTTKEVETNRQHNYE